MPRKASGVERWWRSDACARSQETSYQAMAHVSCGGMPMHQVSKQIGHKSVVITAKHYAHVIGDDVANSVRSLSGDMGIA